MIDLINQEYITEGGNEIFLKIQQKAKKKNNETNNKMVNIKSTYF